MRDDPPALALRGIAMAQLGEHPRARELLRGAARRFGRNEAVARARCVVAEAEVALAMRDFGGSPRALAAAVATLHARADAANALHGRLIAVRRLMLLGRLHEASAALASLDARGAPPAFAAIAGLVEAELAMRSLRIGPAEDAVARASVAAEAARVPALVAEVTAMRAALDRPAARCHSGGGERVLRLDEVAALIDSGVLVVDACRHGIRSGTTWLSLARRPVLFTLARTLAAAWPGEVDRKTMIACAFGTRRPDDTHRARLRVEIGRLRTLVATVACIDATAQGFVLRPRRLDGVAVIAPPIDGEDATLVALLSDGAPWSTSALALAVAASQRTVQRALVELEADGRVRSIGRARTRRWLAPPLAGFTTILLLPASLPPA